MDDLPSGSNDESNLGLGIDEEVSFLLGASLSLNVGEVSGGVLGSVLLGGLRSGLSGGSTVLLGGSTGFDLSLEELGVSGLLLHNVLWDNSCPKTKHDTVMLVS